MDTSIRINRILNQIDTLDYNSRINLVEKILDSIKIRKSKKSITILTELNGLGTDIWENIDIEKYIESERQWE
jgi:hypothetical protein